MLIAWDFARECDLNHIWAEFFSTVRFQLTLNLLKGKYKSL